MNEKLIQICESVARIETLLNMLIKRVEALEKKEEDCSEDLNQAKGVMRAAAIIATIVGSASAVTVELLLRR